MAESLREIIGSAVNGAVLTASLTGSYQLGSVGAMNMGSFGISGLDRKWILRLHTKRNVLRWL